MNRAVQIEVEGRRRWIAAEEFPVSCGAGAVEIRVDVTARPGPVAWIGQTEGDLFVEKADGEVPLSCNGLPVKSSQWLHDGDEIRIGNSSIRLRTADGAPLLVVETIDDLALTEPPAIVPTRVVLQDQSAHVSIRPVEFRPADHAPKPRSGRRLRPAALIVWSLIVSLSVAAWFVFTMRSVELRIDPRPERVSVEGGFPAIPLAGRYLLRQGDYRVLAERRGYEPLDVALEVTDHSRQLFEYRLMRLPDQIDVGTGEVSGARVIVDGLEIGVTPLSPFPLPAGEHELLVQAERYADHAVTFSVEGGGETIVLAVSLVPLWAPVTFRSQPEGATVRVDGESLGETPLTGEILEGRHRLQIQLAGHKPYADTMQVQAGVPLDLPLVRLTPADALLWVRSEPPGAIVTVDGEYGGETPSQLSLVPGRSSEIALSKTGFEPATRQVELRSGENSTITIELEPRYGEVMIRAEPPDAELFVDGAPRGSADQRLRLVAVPHLIEIRKEGYVPYRTHVTPKPDYPQAVRAMLKTQEQLEAERRPPLIRTSEGQEMVLIESGRFRTGAPRREPGRRSNETQRDVELTRPFYVSVTEISNRAFRRFRPGHLSGAVRGHNLEVDTHPVVRVGWEDAAQYCNWLSQQESLEPFYEKVSGRMVAVRPSTHGYRLPTEAEWAWVARYAPDGRSRKYPWGQVLPVTAGSGNYADQQADDLLATALDEYDDGYPVTAPVDSFPPDDRGMFNLGGNVAEWVHDIYTVYGSGESTVVLDPLGPIDGELHVIRGSSWMDATVSELRLTFRDYGKGGRPDLGFRIARYAE